MTETQQSKPALTSDLIAGLTASIPTIPVAMASGVLAGVSPINSLYCLLVGTPIEALFTGSAFMSVTITSVMAITIGFAMGNYQGEEQIFALVTIALVIGVVQLGFLVRFVSNAVMTGFLSGLGVLIELSQLGDLTGYSSALSNKVAKAVDLVFHLGQVDVPTTIVGLATKVVILMIERTRLDKFAMLLGLLIVAGLPLMLGWDSVLLVGDTADIPAGLPGVASRGIMIFTFIATLAMPIQYAVFLGVMLGFVLHIFRAAERVGIREIVRLEGGRYEERHAPKQLPGDQVITLFPKGSLFFAGAAVFEEDLPEIGSAERTVGLLGLRGRDKIGSIFQRVVTRYAANLTANQGKLLGVSEHVYHQLQKTGLLDQLGKENVYRATSTLCDSAREAYQDASAWLSGRESGSNPPQESGR